MSSADGVADLARIQAWMQTVVVHRGTLDEAVAHGDARTATRPEDVLLPSATLAPAERVGIYHRMFGFRMLGAIGGDVPVLRKLVGEDAFRAFVWAYLEAHPSRTWTLNVASHALADFLPTHGLAQERPWLVDVARLERAWAHAGSAAVAQTLANEALVTLAPEAWERARLAAVPSLSVLELAHDVEPLFSAYRADPDAELPVPAARSTRIAVWRHHGRQRLVLEPAAHAMLVALADGRLLAEAIVAAFPQGPQTAEDLALVQSSMQRWVAAGLFSEVRLDD